MPEKRAAIDGVLRAQNPLVPPDSVLIRWVVVCDWALPDGTRELVRVADDSSTIWEIEAMLRASDHGGYDNVEESG